MQIKVGQYVGDLAYVVLALGLAVAALLVYASTRPDVFSISRSATIKAPPDKVFPLIDDLSAFNRWNPFLAKDPATKLTYRGPVRGPGAAHDWVGNRNVGQGSVEITESVPASKIVMKLDMIKPMTAHNRVEFTLQPQGDTTTVTWTMSGKQPLLAKAMTVFFDCDRMVGGSFAEGLAKLKTLAEAR